MTIAVAPTMADEREVGAAVLLNAYWHIHTAELILEGTSPQEANELCWRYYYFGPMQDFASHAVGKSLVESYQDTVYPGGQPPLADPLTSTPDHGPHPHWTTRCLQAALIDDQRLLATDWQVLRWRRGRCPRARIAACHVDSLRWQAHMIWIMATGGGDLLQSARIAYDRATGRPARKRRPADPAWLASQLETSLSATWDALRTADDGTGKPYWPTPPDQTRPRACEGAITARAARIIHLLTS